MPKDAATTSEPVSKPDRSAQRGFFPLVMIAALMAGLLSGLAVLQFGNFFRYPPELEAKITSVNSQLDFREIAELDRQYVLKNTTLCGALCGMLMAGTIGLCAGFSRSIGRATAGLGLGLILGGILGAGGGGAGATVYQHLVDGKHLLSTTGDTSTPAVIASSIVWAAIGLAAGAVAGIGGPLRRSLGGAIAGLCGGALAAWLFLVVASLALPEARTGVPIPENLETLPTIAARILWAFLPAVLIGLLAAVGAAPPIEQPKAPESEPEAAK